MIESTNTAMADGKHAAHNTEFYLKEYESLRKELDWHNEYVRSTEKAVALAVGVVWAWLVTHPQAKWPWFIPVLFVVLGILRSISVSRHFGRLHEYLKQLESAFSANGDPGGWEHYLRWQSQSLSKSSIAFWTVLLLASIGVALYECSL